jgi:hypothetical protein
MATAYDTWKTAETFTDEDTFVSERMRVIQSSWMASEAKVKEYVDDAMSEDPDSFSSRLASIYASVTISSTDRSDADQAIAMRNFIHHSIESKMRRDAETQAQAEWDNRSFAPES